MFQLTRVVTPLWVVSHLAFTANKSQNMGMPQHHTFFTESRLRFQLSFSKSICTENYYVFLVL